MISMSDRYDIRQSVILNRGLLDASYEVFAAAYNKSKTVEEKGMDVLAHDNFISSCLYYSLYHKESPRAKDIKPEYLAMYIFHKKNEDIMRMSYAEKVANGQKGGRPKGNTDIVKNTEKTT